MIGVVVHFHNQTIASDCNGGPPHGQNFVTFASPMTWIHQYGQVTQTLRCGHETQIECIARVIGERPHSALTKNDVVVAFAHHVLSGH